MRSLLTRISVVLIIAAAASPAFAQRLKSIPIDEGFVVTALGPNGIFQGHQTYSFVAYHKVVNLGGKVFVCGAIRRPIFLNEKFLQRGKITSSDGTILKRGLTKFSKINLTNEEKKIIQAGGKLNRGGEDPVDSILAGVRKDADQYRGQAAKCLRVRKSWRESFGDGKSILSMPSRVLIRVPS